MIIKHVKIINFYQRYLQFYSLQDFKKELKIIK
jgi:hypothetical protein